MLDRFRSLVKRLELQPGDETVVYRIIDDDNNAVEVTPSEYARWRVQHDVAKRAIVGQDTVGDVIVRTTFSIMPENRGYKPFGTSAYLMPLYDPLTQYSRRYDTWQESELGHWETVYQVGEELKEARESANSDAAQREEVEFVRSALSSGVPGLFLAEPVPAATGTLLRTPLLLPDGAFVDLLIRKDGEGFVLTGFGDTLDWLDRQQAEIGRTRAEGQERQPELLAHVCEILEVSLVDGVLTGRANSASQLPRSVVALAQAIVCVSYMPP